MASQKPTKKETMRRLIKELPNGCSFQDAIFRVREGVTNQGIRTKVSYHEVVNELDDSGRWQIDREQFIGLMSNRDFLPEMIKQFKKDTEASVYEPGLSAEPRGKYLDLARVMTGYFFVETDSIFVADCPYILKNRREFSKNEYLAHIISAPYDLLMESISVSFERLIDK